MKLVTTKEAYQWISQGEGYSAALVPAKYIGQNYLDVAALVHYRLSNGVLELSSIKTDGWIPRGPDKLPDGKYELSYRR